MKSCSFCGSTDIPTLPPLSIATTSLPHTHHTHHTHTTPHTHTLCLGRTPLHKGSARRRGCYKRQASMPWAGSEPAIPVSERPQTCASVGTTTGIRCRMLLRDELNQPGTAPVTRPCILLQFEGEQLSVSVFRFLVSCTDRVTSKPQQLPL